MTDQERIIELLFKLTLLDEKRIINMHQGRFDIMTHGLRWIVLKALPIDPQDELYIQAAIREACEESPRGYDIRITSRAIDSATLKRTRTHNVSILWEEDRVLNNTTKVSNNLTLAMLECWIEVLKAEKEHKTQ